MVFLLGPLDQVLQQWQPDVKSFLARKPGDPSSERRWEWDEKGYEQRWSLRSAFGKRCTIWSGGTRAAPKDGDKEDASTTPVKSTVLKAGYLPSGLVHHEFEMLTFLDPEAPASDSLFYKIDEETRAAIKKDIPIPLGMVDLGEGGPCETRRLPDGSGLVTDDTPPGLTERLTHLELAVVAMHGPVGKNVDVIGDDLSLVDVCEILLGALGHGYYGATRNLHFRDWSENNVLYIRLPNGRLQGFLIDWGNARHENKRRDQSRTASGPKPDWIYLSVDDMRSGTDWFRCLAVIETAQLLKAYNQMEDDLPSVAKGTPEHAKKTAKLAEQKSKILRARHRYIDDLESFMWLLCYWVSLIFTRCAARFHVTSKPSLVDLHGAAQGSLDEDGPCRDLGRPPGEGGGVV